MNPEQIAHAAEGDSYIIPSFPVMLKAFHYYGKLWINKYFYVYYISLLNQYVFKYLALIIIL